MHKATTTALVLETESSNEDEAPVSSPSSPQPHQPEAAKRQEASDSPLDVVVVAEAAGKYVKFSILVIPDELTDSELDTPGDTF